jgi:hypothetical protein
MRNCPLRVRTSEQKERLRACCLPGRALKASLVHNSPTSREHQAAQHTYTSPAKFDKEQPRALFKRGASFLSAT